MSLVPTFVQSREGNWYKNPIVDGLGYFVCWDDDEPIEVVVEKGKTTVADVLAALARYGWPLRPRGKPRHYTGRYFGKVMKPAIAQFVTQTENGPPDAILPPESRVAGHTGDCVLYYNKGFPD